MIVLEQSLPYFSQILHKEVTDFDLAEGLPFTKRWRLTSSLTGQLFFFGAEIDFGFICLHQLASA